MVRVGGADVLYGGGDGDAEDADEVYGVGGVAGLVKDAVGAQAVEGEAEALKGRGEVAAADGAGVDDGLAVTKRWGLAVRGQCWWR